MAISVFEKLLKQTGGIFCERETWLAHCSLGILHQSEGISLREYQSAHNVAVRACFLSGENVEQKVFSFYY